MRAGHHHGSNRPTSPRAILHHTDPNGPNILKGSVSNQSNDNSLISNINYFGCYAWKKLSGTYKTFFGSHPKVSALPTAA